MKKLFLLLLITMMFGVSNSYGAEPLIILKGEIDRVFSILNDTKYEDETKKEEQYNNLWEIIDGIFNFKIMSRFTLANNWRNFSPEQQKEFEEVFGRFLGNNYLDKIQSGFSGEKVEYVGEDMINDKKAVVMTNIMKNNVKTPVNYGMIRQGSSRKIYDVKIEGVSLLKNYRSQFRGILMKKKPDQLIDSLKNKLK